MLVNEPAILRNSSDLPLRLLVDTAQADLGASSASLDLGQGQRAQIALSDSAPRGEPLAAAIPLGIEGFDRLEAVYRLLAALHGRAIPPDTRLTKQQRARAQRMLRAVDGVRDGATQQEIAQILFDLDRLGRDEWQASSARHAIMSLLRGARTMIGGGYRKLLRHRRRP
ncbi:MAG: DUF2285 domain-containing protein [Alphaproteobacteria bacterium]|nr:DUF2285 domain-containing protein [Alphaproteobacteria bacterium]